MPLAKLAGLEKNEDIGIHDMNKMSFLIRYRTHITSEMMVYYDSELTQVDFDRINFTSIDFDIESHQNKMYNIKSVSEPENTRRQWLRIETVNKN